MTKRKSLALSNRQINLRSRPPLRPRGEGPAGVPVRVRPARLRGGERGGGGGEVSDNGGTREQRRTPMCELPLSAIITRDGRLFADGPTNRKVFLNFGKPIAWLGLTPEQATNIGNSLLKHSRECRGITED